MESIDMDSSTTTTIPTGCTNNTAITGFYTMTSNTTLCSDEVYNAQIQLMQIMLHLTVIMPS